MQTVFSHIIQKRFSRSYEDVATDALAFILKSSDSARTGMIKLIRGIDKDIPSLQFRTQMVVGNIRPDMVGIHESDPRVFIENKFWAGLTENQPIAYLQQLAEYTQPSILLVVGPEAREQTLWRELIRRLEVTVPPVTGRDMPASIVHYIKTEIGPILALTSWQKVLSMLEREVADDQSTRSDLHQLRALCEAADIGVFTPISSDELTDQRIPAFILDLGTLALTSSELAVTEGVLNIIGLHHSKSYERLGRYARFSNEHGVGIWLGIHFQLWKNHGDSPFWLIFDQDNTFGRAGEVQPLLEPWAAKQDIFTSWEDNEFVMAIDIETGEEKDQVVRAIVDRLKEIADVLLPLAQKQEVLDDK
ncbi:hypothetical protein KA005_59025 [bacterium]|nr:hypothetical protein [bacterium]